MNARAFPLDMMQAGRGAEKEGVGMEGDLLEAVGLGPCLDV